MINQIINSIAGKKIILLGFGREGVSSYSLIRKYLPEQFLTIADQSEVINTEIIANDPNVKIIAGKGYDENLNDYDLIMKSPGVNLSQIRYYIPPEKITSQTALFLKFYGEQVVGITGTKGKSTTASLIWHFLKSAGKDALLAGNIGVPFFDIIDQLHAKSVVVAELSAHQLEYLDSSPKISILLNLYQEHLDHFNSYSNYQMAKFNIINFQKESDYLIYNLDNPEIVKGIAAHDYHRQFLAFSTQKIPENGAYYASSQIRLVKSNEVYASFDVSDLQNLPGKHNYNNVMAAILASKIFNIDDQSIIEALKSYQPLEHRIEYVGEFQNIKFYNDSISTIPEATIAAINSLKRVTTVILGGFDRGIDYHLLNDFLAHSEVENVAFMGPAGERILKEWKESGEKLPEHYIVENDFSKIVRFAFDYTGKGKTCLFSPAAASYDQFKNFEERGKVFKETILAIHNKIN